MDSRLVLALYLGFGLRLCRAGLLCDLNGQPLLFLLHIAQLLLGIAKLSLGLLELGRKLLLIPLQLAHLSAQPKQVLVVLPEPGEFGSQGGEFFRIFAIKPQLGQILVFLPQLNQVGVLLPV